MITYDSELSVTVLPPLYLVSFGPGMIVFYESTVITPSLQLAGCRRTNRQVLLLQLHRGHSFARQIFLTAFLG